MDHDRAHELLYSLPEVVADLLCILAADWTEDLDFPTLERLPAEYVDAGLRERNGDMSWRVRFRDGTLQDGSRLYLLLMIEFQSTVDRGMAGRVRE